MKKKVLVLGATGQIGTDLTIELRKRLGGNNVVAVGHKKKPSFETTGPYVTADVRQKNVLEKIIKKYKITEIYHLAALLSATGENHPHVAWDVNMTGLKNVLDCAVSCNVKKVFWPSSIAVFGKTTPRKNTPQQTIIEPTTMYGVTKLAGESLCNYYHLKFGLDVRSLRFPGLISYKQLPGGGTTDYAVAIFYDAIKKGSYKCFVKKETVLPMMYMDDAITSIIKLMNAPKSKIKIRTSYNLAAVSFSVKQLAKEIQKHIPEFTCTYKPDARQKIADSWPQSINDSKARKDWGWKHKYGLKKIVSVMLKEVGKKLS